MLRIFRRRDDKAVVKLYDAVVAQSRASGLYGEGGLPDTTEGRFESLALHALLVLRRLRRLPDPAADVAQDLVDRLFAHLEIALRELGVGDFGVPKRMKKIAGDFYDRVRLYDPPIETGDASALASLISAHLSLSAGRADAVSSYVVESETTLAVLDLDGIINHPSFAPLRADVTAIS